jgi:5-methylcytosine-specific restriction endonuclease McrBC regulatory subunit McrC
MLKIEECEKAILENEFSKTGEINTGFECINHGYYQVKDKVSEDVAYFITANDDIESCELARFFVPKEYRGSDFSKNAALEVFGFIYETKNEVWLEASEKSINFWLKVFDEVNAEVNQEVDYKFFLTKKLVCF